MMIGCEKRHNIWFKTIAIGIACLFLFNDIAWTYLDGFSLSVQSIFKPLRSYQIRDIGIIRYYIHCLAKAVIGNDENVNFIEWIAEHGDVNANVGNEINIALEFTRKDEDGLRRLLDNGVNKYIIPCKINRKSLYYAYITLSENCELDALTVFTKKEFEEMKSNGVIFHKERDEKDERGVYHEEVYDTPLIVAHSNKIGIEPVPDELKEKALEFFIQCGEDPEGDFIRESREFLWRDNNVVFIPNRQDLQIKIGEKIYFTPVKIDKFHVSNNYVNIPRDVYEDTVKVLVHALWAKHETLGGNNIDYMNDAYKLWRMSKKTARLTKKLLRITGKLKSENLRKKREAKDYGGRDGEQQKYTIIPKSIINWTGAMIIPIIVLSILGGKHFLSALIKGPLPCLPVWALGPELLFMSLIVLLVHEGGHIAIARLLFGKGIIVKYIGIGVVINGDKFYKLDESEPEKGIRKQLWEHLGGIIANALMAGIFVAILACLQSVSVPDYVSIILTDIIMWNTLFAIMNFYPIIQMSSFSDGYKILDALNELKYLRKKRLRPVAITRLSEAAMPVLARYGRITGLPAKRLNNANFRPGGSPADYLAALGENSTLQTGHTTGEYKKIAAPPVSDRTIRRDRRKLEERKYLKRGPYIYKKGHEYSLTEEGKRRFDLIDGLKTQTEQTIDEFVGGLRNLSLSLKSEKKILLALDEDLGREGTVNLIRKIIKDICHIDKNKQLEKILQNLIIIKGRSKALADKVKQYTEKDGKDGIKVEKSNVIIIAKAMNKEHYSGFKEEALITFVDDSELDTMDYYPFIEIVLFTLAKALYYKGVPGYDKNKLIALYESLNLKKTDEAQSGFLYIENNLIEITLLPAKPFEYYELQHIYRNIREFLQAA